MVIYFEFNAKQLVYFRNKASQVKRNLYLFGKNLVTNNCFPMDIKSHKMNVMDTPFDTKLVDVCFKNDSNVVTFSGRYGNIDNRTKQFVSAAFEGVHHNTTCNNTYYVKEIFRFREIIVVTSCAYKKMSDTFFVSIIIHMLENRIKNIHRIMQSWKGPLVIVIEVEKDNMCKVYNQIYKLISDKYFNLAVVLVVKQSDVYPINWMRNIGQLHAITDYIMHIDADFIPSPYLYQTILHNASFWTTMRNAALIIPAFENMSIETRIPQNKSNILAMKESVQPFHIDKNPCGHGRTNYEKWQHSDHLYEINPGNKCFNCYEPYFVVDRQLAPLYPETLLNRFYNKLPGFGELCHKKFQFLVHPEAYLVHIYHKRSMKLDNSKLDDLFPCIKKAWKSYNDQKKEH
jgi:hypothetical protein